MADAERSSIEIKVLLRNLDPNKSSIKHKDRIRRLNKFRDYVTARPPPEFYDDDYNLLLLGSESPTVMENEELEGVNLVGLLRASGCPRSVDHMDALKRSARPAISLLRYLCLDFGGDAEPSSAVGENASRVVGLLSRRLNGFASALCALNVPQLRLLRFDIHVGGGTDCGGSKDDACRLLALILTRHTDTDRETPKPLRVHDVLPDARSRAIFDSWLGENASPDVRRAIRENINAASNSGGGDHAMGGGGGAAAAAESISSAAAVAEGEVGRGRNPFQNDDDVNEDFLKVLGKKSRSILDYARSAVFLPKWKGNDGTKSARSAIISPSSSHHDEFNDIDTLDSSSDINSFESRIRAAALSRADEIRNETLQTGGTQDDAETAAVRAVLSFYIDEEGPSCGPSSSVMPLLLTDHAASSSSMTKTTATTATNADDPGSHQGQTITTFRDSEASSASSEGGRSMSLNNSRNKTNNKKGKLRWRAFFGGVRRSAQVEARDVSSSDRTVGNNQAPKEGCKGECRDHDTSIDAIIGPTSIKNKNSSVPRSGSAVASRRDDLPTDLSLRSNASYDKKNLPGKIGDMVINFVDTVHARLCPGNTNYGGGTYSSTLREFLYHVDLTVLPFCGSEESENQSVGPVNPSKWKRESTVSTSLRHVRSIVAPLPYIATPNESHAIDAGGREVSFEEDDYANLCTRYLTPRIIKKVELITRKTDRAEVYRLLCQLRDWELEHGRMPTALEDFGGDEDVSEVFDTTKEVDKTAGSECIDVDEYIADALIATAETSGGFIPPHTSSSKQKHHVSSHACDELAKESLSNARSDTVEVTASPMNGNMTQYQVQGRQRPVPIQMHHSHHSKEAPHPGSGHFAMTSDSCSGSITRGNDYNPNWRDSVLDTMRRKDGLISNAAIATGTSCQHQGVAPHLRGGQFPQVSPSSEGRSRSYVCQIRDRELDQGRVPTALRDDAGDKDILESFDVTKDGDETAGSEFIDVDEYIANVFSLQTKHQAASSGGPVYRYV